MITASDAVFPNNVVSLLARRIETLDEDLAVFRRPLRRTDPNQSVGVYASYWTPNEDSYEFIGSRPTLSTYLLGVEAYIKDGDEERGLATHSVLTSMIRAMLYGDPALLVGLRSLSALTGSGTERTQRFGIRTQRYSSNELQGAFLYLSVLEFWLETETMQ